jgi:hypothetical protein
MRVSRQTWKVLVAVVTMTLLTCSCAGKKPASPPGQSEKNLLTHEVFLTQINDTVIAGGDLLFVGEARVPAEVRGGAAWDHVSATVKAPFQDSCFSLVRGGLPRGKELRIVGRGWSESRPIQGGNRMVDFTFIELLTCEVRPGH